MEGLARRDVQWLRKIARDKKRAGLSSDELGELLSVAYHRYEEGVSEETRTRSFGSETTRETWLVLCEAIIVAGEEQLCRQMVRLVHEHTTAFGLREFQIPAAIKLRAIAAKRSASIGALEEWHGGLRDSLEAVTVAEPEPPKDYRRPSDTGCDCSYCRQLSEFLDDPELEQTRIAAAKQNRQHLAGIISSRKLDVLTKTVRVGSPHSLELTKTCASHHAAVTQYHKDLVLLEKLRN